MRTVYWSLAILFIILIGVSGSGVAAGPEAGLPGQGPETSDSFAQFLTASFPKEPVLTRENIPPLYTEPKMSDEGVWLPVQMPGAHDPAPLIYRTFYRPSAEYPNAIAHMLLFDMKHISPKVYLGSSEPYKKPPASGIDDANQSRLLAITNALWQSKHAGRAGIVVDGEVLRKLEPGVATIVVYKNDSMDILEWNDQIPLSDVRDARQLMHLIVKDGKVVTTLTKRGQPVSAEIGLGSLLNETRPLITVPASSPDEKPSQQMNFTSGDLWFLATRSAFGIRPDGNLVFAVGHHISTADLAKALVLAGCVRAIHGDANPGNCVGILCFPDANGKIVGKAALSPLQDKSTLDRYVNKNYSKDFFAFFRRTTDGN